MKTYFNIILLLVAVVLTTPLHAKKQVVQKPLNQKIYLVCNALTTSYTYTTLREEVSGDLTKDGCTLVHSLSEADWTVQIVGAIGAQQKAEFGSQCFYSTEVSVTIMIDRGAYASRVFETILTEQGKDTRGFDEAAVEAYKRLTPKVCETIKQHIQ